MRALRWRLVGRCLARIPMAGRGQGRRGQNRRVSGNELLGPVPYRAVFRGPAAGFPWAVKHLFEVKPGVESVPSREAFPVKFGKVE